MRNRYQAPKKLCFSTTLLTPYCFFPLTAQQRRLRKMYLSDYLQGLRYSSVYTDDQVKKKKKWLPGTQDYVSLRHEWIFKNRITIQSKRKAIASIAKRIHPQTFLGYSISSGKSAANRYIYWYESKNTYQKKFRIITPSSLVFQLSWRTELRKSSSAATNSQASSRPQ